MTSSEVAVVQRVASPGIAQRTCDARYAVTAPAVQVRTCILVAGMHRSGTSATTRVLNLLGADLAGDLVDGIPGDNDRGFWESHATYRLHDRLFASLGSAWHDPYPLPDGWQETDAAREAKRAIREHIETQFSDSGIFVVKDPRMTRALPLWLAVLDELAITPLIVIPFRNPLEVAASLERRDGLALVQSLLVYIQGNLAAEGASRGRPRLFQLYDELISDWRSFAAKLANVGGLHANALGSAVADEIDRFLTSDLHRHRASPASIARAPEGTTLAEMYDHMVRAAATRDDTPLRACFDRVRQHMASTKTFGAVASARGREYRDEMARLEAKTTGEAQRRGAEIEQLRAQVRALETRLRDAVRAQTNVDEGISGMRGSTSWRVTAPLRAFRRLGKSIRWRR